MLKPPKTRRLEGPIASALCFIRTDGGVPLTEGADHVRLDGARKKTSLNCSRSFWPPM